MAELRGRSRKIMEALYRLSPDGPRLVTYEDIVVTAWTLYPDDFGLRGYSEQYPDSSDIHVPLYKELKSQGLVATGPTRQKKFRLTPAGWDLAHSLFDGGDEAVAGSGRLSRSASEELRHIERATATTLYLTGDADNILDSDFFAFYRTSVRAPSREFESRLSQARRAIDEARVKQDPRAGKLDDVDRFLRAKFGDIIALKTSVRPGSDE